MMSQFSQMTSSLPGGAAAQEQMQPFMASMNSSNPIGSFIAAAQAHAARYPQQQAPQTPSSPASSSAPNVVEQPSLSANEPRRKTPEEMIDATKSNIADNNKRLAQRERAYGMRTARIREQYAGNPDLMKQMLDDEAVEMERYRRTVKDSNDLLESRITALEQMKGNGSGSQGSASVSAPSAGAAAAMSSGGGGGGAGGGGSSGGGSSGGATPVSSAPTTGTDIGNASTAVAAGAGASSSGPTTQVVNAESASSSVGGNAQTIIPSPVADRGSLDKGITFEAATN
jgi:hypothetical protein